MFDLKIKFFTLHFEIKMPKNENMENSSKFLFFF